MISVGIVGGSGYTGKKLFQFLSVHPNVDEIKVYGNTTAGENLLTIFPDLEGLIEDSVIESVSNVSLKHDLYFIAVPHGEALNYVPFLTSQEKKVIDLGGDYRLDMEEIYTHWYKIKHTSPYLLKKKIYGLADYYDYTGNDSLLVANPGCYPTVTLLSLLPLVQNFSNDILTISTNAYSGTSGAGKSAKTELLMSEMDGNVRAYNVNQHRHQPEIIQELERAGLNSPFSFTTHLLPVSVGIYSTTSIHMKNKILLSDLNQVYKKSYEDSNFVRLRKMPPDLNWVIGTNFCDMNLSVNGTTIIITAAIDNLVKGASGQAIQNMNKLYGWDEKLSLIKKGVKDVSVY
jgi:N-acetyl-gamma-glutamyl-phosphate reductase